MGYRSLGERWAAVFRVLFHHHHHHHHHHHLFPEPCVSCSFFFLPESCTACVASLRVQQEGNTELVLIKLLAAQNFRFVVAMVTRRGLRRVELVVLYSLYADMSTGLPERLTIPCLIDVSIWLHFQDTSLEWVFRVTPSSTDMADPLGVCSAIIVFLFRLHG